MRVAPCRTQTCTSDAFIMRLTPCRTQTCTSDAFIMRVAPCRTQTCTSDAFIKRVAPCRTQTCTSDAFISSSCALHSAEPRLVQVMRSERFIMRADKTPLAQINFITFFKSVTPQLSMFTGLFCPYLSVVDCPLYNRPVHHTSRSLQACRENLCGCPKGAVLAVSERQAGITKQNILICISGRLLYHWNKICLLRLRTNFAFIFCSVWRTTYDVPCNCQTSLHAT